MSGLGEDRVCLEKRGRVAPNSDAVNLPLLLSCNEANKCGLRLEQEPVAPALDDYCLDQKRARDELDIAEGRH